MMANHFLISLLADIQQASSSIHMMFFIVKNDKIGQRVLQALKAKAEQGVSVFLLTDRLGSYPFDQKSIDMLEKSGIQFYFLNKPRFPFLIYRLNMRNHRKITVIDGKIGYIGGFNIGDEYVGKNGQFGIWKDYHLRMTGQVVADLQHVFLNDLYYGHLAFISRNMRFFLLWNREHYNAQHARLLVFL
nr:phospholipase D-like domain-containing protein [Bacillus pumilus]